MHTLYSTKRPTTSNALAINVPFSLPPIIWWEEKDLYFLWRKKTTHITLKVIQGGKNYQILFPNYFEQQQQKT